MTLLTDAQLVAVARYGGFSDGAGYQGRGLTWAVAVALAESSGRTDATGYNPGPPVSYDRGLWQINNYYHPQYSDHTCYDPYGCAGAAFRISNSGTNWRPWTTFKNGMAAEKYNRAFAAVTGTAYSGPPVTGALPGGPTSQQVNAAAIIEAALDFARAQLGKPYIWGGTGPDGYDCSGLTQAAYGAGGLILPRTAAQQYAATPQVDINTPQPGDLVFAYMGADDRQDHVGIYEGDGVMIVAPRTGDVVKRQAYTTFPGRAVTRPTAVALPSGLIGGIGGGRFIVGCTPLAPTPVLNDLVLDTSPPDETGEVYFLPPPISGGPSSQGQVSCLFLVD